MKKVISGLKNSQKVRVIVDRVGMYMTVKDAVCNFATTSHATAVRMALESLVQYNRDNEIKATGHVGGWNGHHVQVDLITE